MSFENYKPLVWNSTIERDLEKAMVFAEDCNRDYEGKAKGPGDSIKILGVGKPTIRHHNDGKLHLLDDPEILEDTSLTMPINQVADFNFFVDDLDKRQAAGNLSASVNEAVEGIADIADKYIASFAAAPEAIKMAKDPILITKDTILGALNSSLTKLYQADVKATSQITATASPLFVEILRSAYEQLDTNNHEMLKNGRIGMYHNMIIKQSNNVHTKDDVEYIMVRTKRALSFANPFTYSEPYKPEKRFGDAVKGYHIFDAKWTRPKEAVIIPVKFA